MVHAYGNPFFGPSEAMAHKKGKKGISVINVSESLPLSTLASNTVLASNSDAFGREAFVVSTDLYWSIRGLTATEGPIVVGVAHNDYSVAEIQEALSVTGMEDPGDQIAKEQGRRLVRRSGQFSGVAANEALNDGKLIRTRLRFMVQELFGLSFFAWNISGATLTTGATIEIHGKVFLRWV